PLSLRSRLCLRGQRAGDRQQRKYEDRRNVGTHWPLPLALGQTAQGRIEAHPRLCSSIRRTTPEGTTLASLMSVTGLPSALLWLAWVLPQAMKVTLEFSSAIGAMRSFTGLVSARSMCSPGP